MQKKVYQQVLDNGFTILVFPKKDAPKVSIQLWYDVGSKHELSGEKGIAHLIEHMIFKGTQKLSESDINLVTTKLSGYCNAFTSYDYTGYLFDIPQSNWTAVLPIMADCMNNCTFKEQFLFSELKAVIQELKMYKDNYSSSLAEAMITAMFPDHPYHYPIIGYKQDLWSLESGRLLEFYKKHYAPQRACMVVVGDVDPQQAAQEVAQHFQDLPPGKEREEPSFYINEDLQERSVTLTRDVQQPIGMVAYAVPGVKEKQDYMLETLCVALASGKASRLHKKLVDEKQLVSSIAAFTYDLFDKGVLFITFTPYKESDRDVIVDLIQEELHEIAQQGFAKNELARATSQAYAAYLSTLEDTQEQAYIIGKYFMALRDPNYMFTYAQTPSDIGEQLQHIVAQYCRKSVRCVGSVVAMPESEKEFAQQLQERSDKEDAKILDGKNRTIPVEPGKYVNEVVVQEPKEFQFVGAEKVTLENGATLLFSNKDDVEKITVAIDYKVDHKYDPAGKSGLAYLASKVLLEGTNQYPGAAFMQAVEQLGMNIYTAPGSISVSMLTKHCQESFTLIKELLTGVVCKEQDFLALKKKQLQQLDVFWDTPTQFVQQLAKDVVYAGHPYQSSLLGKQSDVQRLEYSDFQSWYEQAFSPDKARVAIVGNYGSHDIKKYAFDVFSEWTGHKVEELVYPSLSGATQQQVKHYIARDQVVLGFSGLSVPRFHEDYDALLLYNEVLTGGTLGAMSSRLFQLREQTGLFYTIGGSLLYGAADQPGMMYIRTIVSQDKMQVAQEKIMETIAQSYTTISDEEFRQARQALLFSLPNKFETYEKTAQTLLFLERYGLSIEYLNSRAKQLRSLSKEHMLQTVGKYVEPSNFTTIAIGRIGEAQ